MEQKIINLSFIIPAYNEELLISETINSINKYVPDSFSHEIIVIDHDSTDKTPQIASKSGANVLRKSGGSIASVRNLGASVATGSILVFLDADVLLTDEWMQHINHAIKQINKNKKLLTGSWVSVPDKACWIEKHWYTPLQHGDNTHINTGHLIISKGYFFEMGGFSEQLETGEDYDFSMRVKSSSGNILDNNNLKVIHKGFPCNSYEFMKREFWHGKGDAKTVKDIMRSKVAVLSLLFLVLHLTLVVGIVFGEWYSAGLSAMFIIIIILVSSIIKYKNAPVLSILTNCFLYYLYFLARSLSLIVFFKSAKMSKHHR